MLLAMHLQMFIIIVILIWFPILIVMIKIIIIIIVIMMIIMWVSTIIVFFIETTTTTIAALMICWRIMTVVPYSTATLTIIEFVIWKICYQSISIIIFFFFFAAVKMLSIGKLYSKGNLMNFSLSRLPLDNDNDDFPFSKWCSFMSW